MVLPWGADVWWGLLFGSVVAHSLADVGGCRYDCDDDDAVYGPGEPWVRQAPVDEAYRGLPRPASGPVPGSFRLVRYVARLLTQVLVLVTDV